MEVLCNVFAAFMEVLCNVVCWTKRVMASGTGQAALYDFPILGHPRAPDGPEMLQRADAFLCENRRIKT